MDGEEAKFEEEASYRIAPFWANELPDNYRAIIFATFLRSLRHGNQYFKLIERDVYFRAYWKYIDHLLRQETAVVRLAVLSDDPDVVLGWSLIQEKSLHFVYVKRDFRKTGIGTSLVPFDIDTITHLTHIGLSIWNNKAPKLKFNPFI